MAYGQMMPQHFSQPYARPAPQPQHVSAPAPPPPPPPSPPAAPPALFQRTQLAQANSANIKFSLQKPKQTLPPAKVLPVDDDDVPAVAKKSQTVKQSDVKGVTGIAESGRAGQIGQKAVSGKKSGSDTDWPQSLKDYVNQAFAKCKTDQEKDEVEHLLKAKLTVAYNNNTVWTTDWRTEPPLVPVKTSVVAGRPASSPPPPAHTYKKSAKSLVRAKRVSRSRKHSSSSSSYRSSSSRSRSRSRSPLDRRRRPQSG